MTNKIKEGNMVFIGILLVIIISGVIGFSIGYEVNNEGYQEGYNDVIYKMINDSFDTGDNYLLMRDLFTPCSWNDTLTIENAGEYWEGYNCTSTFWVNHSNVCWSYYFVDANCYRVAVPTWGDEELWVVEFVKLE